MVIRGYNAETLQQIDNLFSSRLRAAEQCVGHKDCSLRGGRKRFNSAGNGTGKLQETFATNSLLN
eukprot:scaffold13166_cov34-Prasinocladus_malaysianus.AAC.2